MRQSRERQADATRGGEADIARLAGDNPRWTSVCALPINRRPQALPKRRAQVAQLVEHATENRSVGGSIPPLGTIPIAPRAAK
jgi:hypothetical protein